MTQNILDTELPRTVDRITSSDSQKTQITEMASGTSSGEGAPEMLVEEKPKVFRGDKKEVVVPDDNEAAQTAASSLARAARDSFRAARNAADQNDAESQFFNCKHSLEHLWKFAAIRSREFRDVLALIEVAIRPHGINDFEADQRDAIDAAFTQLTRPFVDEVDLDRIIQSFVTVGIDITPPVTEQTSTRRFRVVIEDIA